MTRTLRIDPAAATPTHPAIREAADLLRDGRLVAFPTETVYGLGADATSASAVEAIYAAKERPADNPLIVHVARLADVFRWTAAMPDQVPTELLRRFWPGPLTVVLPAGTEVRPATRGLDAVALRMPDHPVALALIEAADAPLAAPSANRSGRPSPTLAGHVAEDLDGRIPLILDGGSCRVGIESTVLDLSRGAPRVLRPGAITAEQIAEFLNTEFLTDDGSHAEEAPRSPGTKYRHYSPRAVVVLVDSKRSVASLQEDLDALRSRHPGEAAYLTLRGDVDELTDFKLYRYDEASAYARGLYADLRACDLEGAALILADLSGEDAVDDRLRRAATYDLTDAAS